MVDNQQIFEREQVIQRLGDEEVFKEIISVFLETCPQYMIQLEEAIQAKELSDAQKAVHKLKGAASNVGSDLVRDNALSVEQAIEKQDYTSIFSRFSDLKENTQALQDILVQELEKNQNKT
ncbi:MAG TPA: Hpt domain-containing protein [Desulfohalobiaceae bacterium]|nr:Hpt domain-containing protein [Desulfohalobiaceae bacterium]